LPPVPPRGDSSGPRPLLPHREQPTGQRPLPARAESSGPRPAPPRPQPGQVTGSVPVPPPQNGRPRPPASPLDSRLNPPSEDVSGRLTVDEPTPKPPPPAPPRAPGPERREEVNPASLTTEMEAIGDDVKKRREVDHTLARFSAVHDELAQQERQRKERRQKLMPWKSEEDEDDDSTQYGAPVGGIEFDDDEPSRVVGRTPKHSRIVRAVKIVALTAAVLIFVTTGLGWGAMLWVDSKFTEIDALNTNSAAVHEAEKQLGDENFLIVGSDTRAGAKPEDGVGDAENEAGARSDVIMLAHIPADRKRVVVVSLPRDLRVTRPACESWNPDTGQTTGEDIPEEKNVLANTAYATGGPKCVSTLMTEITHLNINHFVSVDFNGFKGMVDAVGTINVCVPKRMDDGELGLIFDKPGRYDVGPDKALDYVRARKVKNEEFGDYDRITRQQKFLSSLLRKVLSSETLLNPGKLNSFINAFAGATRGQNLGVDQLLTLAQSLQGLEAGRVSFVTIPHETAEGPTKSPDDNTEEMKQAETDALFKAIIEGTPLPGETPDATPTTAPSGTPKPTEGPKQGAVVDPKTVKVQVLNGNEKAGGAAGRTKTALVDLGFDVVNLGNSPSVDKTIIKYGKGGEDWAATLHAAVPSAVLQVDESMGGAVALVIGPGFDENIVAPQAGGTTPAPGKTAPPADLSIVNGGADACT
jgi:LCP family protein required for cell wall assembly